MTLIYRSVISFVVKVAVFTLLVLTVRLAFSVYKGDRTWSDFENGIDLLNGLVIVFAVIIVSL